MIGSRFRHLLTPRILKTFISFCLKSFCLPFLYFDFLCTLRELLHHEREEHLHLTHTVVTVSMPVGRQTCWKQIIVASKSEEIILCRYMQTARGGVFSRATVQMEWDTKGPLIYLVRRQNIIKVVRAARRKQKKNITVENVIKMMKKGHTRERNAAKYLTLSQGQRWLQGPSGVLSASRH